MAGYIGSKAVLLSTTAAVVAGDADISGDLTVDTNTLFVDAANNRVGIGTSSPTFAKLKVSASNAGGAIMSEDTSSTGSFVRVLGDVSSQNLINWQDGTSLRFASSTQDYASFAERMRIDSSGHLIVPAGVTLGTSAGVYNAVNTLDDYEEGTWTPTVGGTATYFIQAGRYTKVGNKVFIEGVIQINVIGTGNTVNIGGLPFVTDSNLPLGTISVGFYSGTTTSISFLSATLDTSNTEINLRHVAAGGSTSMGAGSILGSTSAIYFSGQYSV